MVEALGAGETELAVSVITLLELAHGVARANTEERRMARQRFLNDLLSGMPVHPVAVSIALRAGQMDGFLQSKGLQVSLADLLIGAPALELEYAVATHNVRHFEMIPELKVLCRLPDYAV